MAISFIGEGIRRKPPTCRKSLTNFITWCCIEYKGFELTTLIVIGTDCIGTLYCLSFVLSVLCIVCPLYCLSIVLSVLLELTASAYHVDWPLYCLPFLDLRLLLITLIGHCIVCPSWTYGFCLSRWLAIVLSALLGLTASAYHGNWPLYCLSFLDLRLLFITLMSSNFSYIVTFIISTLLKLWGRRGRYRIVVGFTTTYAISAYHYWCCEFKSRSGRSVQHYVIKFVSDRWFSSGTPVSSTNNTDRHDITEILLKVALNIIKQTNKQTISNCGFNIFGTIHAIILLYNIFLKQLTLSQTYDSLYLIATLPHRVH